MAIEFFDSFSFSAWIFSRRRCLGQRHKSANLIDMGRDILVAGMHARCIVTVFEGGGGG